MSLLFNIENLTKKSVTQVQHTGFHIGTTDRLSLKPANGMVRPRSHPWSAELRYGKGCISCGPSCRASWRREPMRSCLACCASSSLGIAPPIDGTIRLRSGAVHGQLLRRCVPQQSASEPPYCPGGRSRRSPGRTPRPIRKRLLSVAGLAALGDCAICHTDASGIVNAGGRAIETPFGMVYSTNITPDPATGIGTWSYPAFERVMREAIHRDGRQLDPAFPHPHFAKVTDADLQALYAYLMVQAPVRAENLRSALTFPFNLRPLLAGWNALFHASSARTGPGKINDMESRRLSGRGPRPLRRMSFASPIASR